MWDENSEEDSEEDSYYKPKDKKILTSWSAHIWPLCFQHSESMMEGRTRITRGFFF